jgi:hypothetical protein
VFDPINKLNKDQNPETGHPNISKIFKIIGGKKKWQKENAFSHGHLYVR